MTTTWLIDKSALLRLPASPDALEWIARIDRGLVSITTPSLLEAGYSARSLADHIRELGTPPISHMPIDYLTPAIEDAALQVQRQLAGRGHHRAPSIPDLLLAATADFYKRTILHLDKDFELIAEVTGQPTERLRLA